MASTVFPAPAAGKTRKVETLVSGTSWTVPTGVTYVNATLIGGGGGSASGQNTTANPYGNFSAPGHGGVQITTTVNTTPGASIAYAIGAGGAGATGDNASGVAGGTTSFTGATSATGGASGKNEGNAVGTAYLSAVNGGGNGKLTSGGGAGGSGCIIVEYWV